METTDTTPLSTVRLVELGRDGDRLALEVVLIRHVPLLRARCRALVGAAEVDDLVQETLLRAVAHIGRLDSPRGFTAFLLRTLRNLCIDHLRARRRRPLGLDPCQPELAAHGESERIERSDLVQRALALLGPVDRQAVAMFHFRGLSYAEIAAHLGLTVAAVNQRISRSRQRLRSGLVA